MKWCRFKTGEKVVYGIIEGDTVIEVEGSPFDSYTRTSNSQPLSSVKLEVPVIPPTFYAAGINYPEHVTWAAQQVGTQPNLPKQADVGYRAANALIAQDEPIIIPKDATEKVQYEGELVAVIGKTCKNVTEEEALDYVLGYTIGNDVSERTWQRGDRTLWRAKNTDTFKPMGPWIETDVDLASLQTTVRLNGEETISFETNNMLYGVERYISAMSKYLTLYPGDVIWMGTEGKSPQMKHGDICEIDITGIGILGNPVVRES